jgi:NAD+ diphosphatase
MSEPAFCMFCGSKLVAAKNPAHKPECPECGWFLPTTALPVVLVLAGTRAGKIVYTRRRDWPGGAWGLVAGYIEPGETAEDAAMREVEEETGLHAIQPHVVSTMSWGDQLLICVELLVDDASPRPGSDADEVLLAIPDPALTPPEWPARAFIESHIAGAS